MQYGVTVGLVTLLAESTPNLTHFMKKDVSANLWTFVEDLWCILSEDCICEEYIKGTSDVQRKFKSRRQRSLLNETETRGGSSLRDLHLPMIQEG